MVFGADWVTAVSHTHRIATQARLLQILESATPLSGLNPHLLSPTSLGP